MLAAEKATLIRPHEQIDVHGFAFVDPHLHMLEWLGRGSDVRQFVGADVETELYAQDQGVPVLSIECTAAPLARDESESFWEIESNGFVLQAEPFIRKLPSDKSGSGWTVDQSC